MALYCAELNGTALDKLSWDPWRWQLKVVKVTDCGEGFFLVYFTTRLIRGKHQMLQNLIIEPQGLRFHADVDT